MIIEVRLFEISLHKIQLKYNISIVVYFKHITIPYYNISIFDTVYKTPQNGFEFQRSFEGACIYKVV